MLTIKEIKVVVESYCPIIHKADITELDNILINQLLKQTNLETIEEVQKVLNLYKNTKSKWLKKGLESVLLTGEFPKVFTTITNTESGKEEHYIQQPIIWPEHPDITYKPYCYEPKQEYISLKKTNIDI